MTRFLSNIQHLSEIYSKIPLYQKINLDEFIRDYGEEIVEIKEIENEIKLRKYQLASVSIFGGGQRVDTTDADILTALSHRIKSPEDISIDSYCPYCKNDSVFDLDDNYVIGNAYQIKADKLNNNQFSISFICSRCKKQRLLFLFELEGVILRKIAQFPSQMDLLLPEVKKYQKELGEYSSEFYTAIGLHASGVGVGAFVYLRRIFEKLILDTYQSNGTNLKMEDEFRGLDMSDKIDLLSEFLPEELTENKSLYGILSIGVHQLSEEDCLRYFDNIRLGIEAILDDIIEKKKKAERKKKIASGVQEIHRDLAK